MQSCSEQVHGETFKAEQDTAVWSSLLLCWRLAQKIHVYLWLKSKHKELKVEVEKQKRQINNLNILWSWIAVKKYNFKEARPFFNQAKIT